MVSERFKKCENKTLLRAMALCLVGVILTNTVLKSGAAGWVIENQFVRVSIDDKGRLTSLFDLANERECIAAGGFGNVFRMYEDVPLYWDAWLVYAYAGM